MTSTLATPLHFAAHLFVVFIALGAAVAVMREDAKLPIRIAGAVAFFLLLVAEALHGGGFLGEAVSQSVALRVAGIALFVLLLVTGRIHRSPWLIAGALFLIGSEVLLSRRETLDWAITGAHAARVAGAAAIAGYIAGAARRSIRFRFMAGFVSVLLVVVLAISVAITQVLDRDQRDAALNRLQAQAVDTTNAIIPLIQEQTEGLVFVVETAVQRVVKEGGVFSDEEMTRLKDSLLPNVNFVLFVDASLLVLGQTGFEGDESFEVVGTPVVSECLRTGLAASLTILGDRDLALVGCKGIQSGGRIIAAAVAGYKMNSELLERIAPPGARAAAFRQQEPVPLAVIGGFPGLRVGAPMIPASVLGSTFEDFTRDQASVERQLRIGRADYFTALTPLARTDGQLVGILMVAEPSTTVAQTLRDVIRLIFLVTLAVVLLALLLALLAARRITRPVLALTRAARSVQAGDLGAKADVEGPDEVGDLARAFNVMTESVTEATDRLRAAAEAEARLRDRLETVLNSMGDALIAVDVNAAVVTYNPAASAILGLARKQVVGKPLDEILTGQAADGGPLVRENELDAGMGFVRRKDGREVPVAITSSPLRDASNAPIGRVYVLRDMSREHEVERMKTEFLSNVSHELRTPLTPIIGYSEIMTRRGVAPGRSQEFATAILDSARRLERIVAMLVDFSAMGGGRMTIEAEPTPLPRVIRGAVEDWKKRSGDHRFITRVAPKLPQAMVDVSLVRRAIDELLDNAVKYSPNGGKIRVGVSSTGSNNGRMLQVDVADEGIGIGEDDLATVFEDFRQIDASDTRMFGGLGLGLAFVRRIVEAHRGTIDVKSEPGSGTTFSFTLPTADTPTRRKKKS